jgi:C-terminal processing protease CtpA/Prc
VDEFSTSAGDIFAAMAQDNGIAKLYGYRTAGAGGTVTESPVGFYSEGGARTTVSLVTRARAYTAPGYPTTSYIENIGVQPDIPADYMTRDNLMNRGTAFVEGFSRAMVGLIADRAKD